MLVATCISLCASQLVFTRLLRGKHVLYAYGALFVATGFVATELSVCGVSGLCLAQLLVMYSQSDRVLKNSAPEPLTSEERFRMQFMMNRTFEFENIDAPSAEWMSAANERID